MIKKILASVMLVGFLCGSSLAADEFALLTEERIGNLRIGLSQGEVRKSIHCALKLGPEEFWAADGAYHQKWEYSRCGIILDMVSEKKRAPKSVNSITLVSPGALSTMRGIRIGSTLEEATKAYKDSWNREDTELFGHFVAGSIYGGLMFHFQNGRVSKIFLGAAAE